MIALRNHSDAPTLPIYTTNAHLQINRSHKLSKLLIEMKNIHTYITQYYIDFTQYEVLLFKK